jgi:hypothetical protein
MGKHSPPEGLVPIAEWSSEHRVLLAIVSLIPDGDSSSTCSMRNNLFLNLRGAYYAMQIPLLWFACCAEPMATL